MPDKVTVFDVETTGVGNRDRIVEIATLTFDLSTGQVVDRFETLINPERDIGATSIHGISASMVELAPTFAEVAYEISRRIDGSILVAHNLAFDTRMLMNEFENIDARFDPGNGFCTLRATRMKLAAACEVLGVNFRNAHHAASDVEATIALAIHCSPEWEHCQSAAVEWVGAESHRRTLTRSAYDADDRDLTSHLLDFADVSFLTDRRLTYADALDHALSDHVLDSQEAVALRELAERLGLSDRQVARIHEQYLGGIIKAAQRDGRISLKEHKVLTRIRSSLAIPEIAIPPITDSANDVINVQLNAVCFTGEVVFGGSLYTRVHMESIAALHGIAPKSSVSRNCDLLVAADPASNSSKARRARELNIPIISAEQFIATYGPEN